MKIVKYLLDYPNKDENILKKKEKYERINNYKKDLDEQIEKNKKYKINEEF